MIPARSKNNIASGFGYLSDGFKLLFGTKLRVYALVPILVNIVLFIGLTTYMMSYFDGLMTELREWLWEWLHFLIWIIGFFAGLIILVAYGYIFNIITNIIAAPFYGMLAQKTEEMLTGQTLPEEPIGKMLSRTITREMSKLAYLIPRSLFFFILTFFIAFLSPILFLWGAWCLAIQYSDYGPDNNQLNFKETRDRLSHSKWSALGFGGSTMICSMIPVLNIVAMPAAVVGGTALWVNEMKLRHV